MDKLVSAQAIINKARIEAKGMKYPEFDVLVEWLVDKTPGIEVPDKDVGEWILCSDRLPEEDTDVLVCNEKGQIAISMGSYSTELSGAWIWYTTGWRFGKVIAWKPLPEPYKGEE